MSKAHVSQLWSSLVTESRFPDIKTISSSSSWEQQWQTESAAARHQWPASHLLPALNKLSLFHRSRLGWWLLSIEGQRLTCFWVVSLCFCVVYPELAGGRVNTRCMYCTSLYCSGQWLGKVRTTFSKTSHLLNRINMQTFIGKLQEDISSSGACHCRFFYEEPNWNESGGDVTSQQEPSSGENRSDRSVSCRGVATASVLHVFRRVFKLTSPLVQQGKTRAPAWTRTPNQTNQW